MGPCSTGACRPPIFRDPVPPALQQDIINPRLRRRLLDTRTSLGQSLAGSLLLSPGSWYTQGSVGVLQESVNSVLGKFGGSVVGLMATSSKRDYAIPRGLMLCTQSPCPCGRPLLTRTTRGDAQIFKDRSGPVSVGSPGVHKVLFEPSEHL